MSSLALSLVEESGEEIPSKNVARAADVPEMADIVSWLKDLTSGIKAAEARIEARERQARLSAPKSKAQIEAVQALLGDLRGRMGEEGER